MHSVRVRPNLKVTSNNFGECILDALKLADVLLSDTKKQRVSLDLLFRVGAWLGANREVKSGSG